jgi:hypothetical protein
MNMKDYPLCLEYNTGNKELDLVCIALALGNVPNASFPMFWQPFQLPSRGTVSLME